MATVGLPQIQPISLVPSAVQRVWVWALVAVGTLAPLAAFNYLLFHTVLELVTVGIAVSVFATAFNSTEQPVPAKVVILGMGYLAVAWFDVWHTLTYSGMGIFPALDANAPTQLWIAARMVELATLWGAITLRRRSLPIGAIGGVIALATALLSGSIALGIFPDAYLADVGLTPFKIVAEWVLIVAAFALALVIAGARDIQGEGRRYLIPALIFTALAEFAFTRYVSVYGPANMVGHLLKLVSYIYIYRATVERAVLVPAREINALLEEEVVARRTTADHLASLTGRHTALSDRYRIILDHVRDGVVLHELTPAGPGPFLEANERACELLGRTRAEIVGLTPWDIQLAPQRAKIPAVTALLAGGHDATFDTLLTRPDGSTVPVEVFARPIDMASRRYVLAVLHDVSERRAAEAEREQHIRTQAQQSKLAIVGEMFESVIHQLRQPISSLGMILELLGDRDGTDPELVDLGRQAIHHLSATTTSIQRFARHRQTDPEWFRPAPVIADACAIIEPQLRSLGISLAVAIESDTGDIHPIERAALSALREGGEDGTAIAEIWGDAEDVLHILLNLLANARDAVRSRYGDRTTSGVIAVYLRRTTESWTAAVEDNGHGVPHELRDQIFDRYVTTKGEEGSGLGLHMSRILARDHLHGDLIVTDGAVGARFELTLPTRETRGETFYPKSISRPADR